MILPGARRAKREGGEAESGHTDDLGRRRLAAGGRRQHFGVSLPSAEHLPPRDSRNIYYPRGELPDTYIATIVRRDLIGEDLQYVGIDGRLVTAGQVMA